MKKMLTLLVMFILCMQTFATTFMRITLKDGNIAKYEIDNIEEIDFEIGKDTSDIGDTTAIDSSNTPLKFRVTSNSTAEVIHSNLYANIDTISIPVKVRIGNKTYSVTSIDAEAFSRCSGLTSIEIPESITNIGNKAFADCSKLTNIEIPDGVTSIGAGAFSGCSGLTSKLLVYDKGTKCYGWIGDKTKCTEVVIPEGVTSIGNSAFYACNSLKSIVISTSVTTIGSHAFECCNSLEPKLLIYNKGTKCYGWIGDETKCTEVVIPEGVTSIENSAFYRCRSLVSINIPESVTSIGVSAFLDCSGLTSINIPNSVTSIETEAFHNCSNLDIVIDNSKDNVKVGGYAFEGCKSVKWLK